MVNETSDRPRLTSKGARTRARIVEEAAALIHEHGVAGTTLEDVKVAAEVSGSQMYHYFPDKNELVQAVIDYQAGTIVTHQRQVLSSANGGEAWRNMVITAAKLTRQRGAAHLARSVVNSPRVTPRPQRSSRPGSISGQPPSAMHSDPCMPTGNSRPTSTRTTSPLLCSPRSKEDFYSPRYTGVPARSKLRSTPSLPLPSADEPKPGSFTAIAEVGSRLLDNARASTRCACGHAAVRDAGHLAAPGGLLRSGIP